MRYCTRNLLLASVLILSACSKNEVVARYIKDMAPDDVIMVVNGEKILVSDYLAQKDLGEKLYRLSKGIAFDQVSEKAAAYSKAKEGFWIDEILRRTILRQEAEARGVQVDARRLEEARSGLLKVLKRKSGTFADLKDALGPASGECLDRNLGEQVRIELLEELTATNDLKTVGDDVVARELESIRAFNLRADKANAKSRARALDFRAKVLSGGNFAELTERMGQVHKEYGREWERADVGAFPPETPLREWLDTAPKTGDLSQPLDMDDGLAIVGVVKVEKGMLPSGEALPDLYTLVRCTFNAYEYMRTMSTNEMRKAILRRRRQDAAKALGDRLSASVKIEFPNGNEFFPEVTETLRIQEKEATK